MSVLPPDISTFGTDKLLWLIFVLVGVWFVAAEVALIAFALIFRKRGGRRAQYLPAASFRGASWVLVPAALVFLFDLGIDQAGASLWHRIMVDRPAAQYRVRVAGKQFYWEFQHPGKDGKLDTEDDVKSINHLYVPLRKVVHYELSAQEVLHSFFVPNLRLKLDAVPGRTLTGWFQAQRPGEYQIVCAELCGVGHSMMRAKLHVLDEPSFAAWLEEGKK